MRKENIALWLKQLNASQETGLPPLPEFLCNVGQVIKKVIQGVTKNPTSTVSYLQQWPATEFWRIGKA